MQKCKSLLDKDRYNILINHKSYIKHPLSKTCGIVREGRTCFLIAPIQLIVRINEAYLYISEYEEFFESLKTSESSIPIDSKLLNKEIDENPTEEDALFAVSFLINELGLLKLLDENYYIKYNDTETKDIISFPFNIQTAISSNAFKKNVISMFDVFTVSIITQIGTQNTMNNIIEIFPPPVIFVEIWRYGDNLLHSFKFDDFFVDIADFKLHYHCVGALIHKNDHYKSVAFDNDNIILLDDELVANLSSNDITNNNFNIFKEIELQDLHNNLILLIFQVVDNQIDQYRSFHSE